MTIRLAAAAALLALFGSGCQDMGPGDAGLLDDIALHRALWASKRPSAYVYELQRICECTVDAQGPVRIRVQGTTVVERSYTASGVPVASGLAGVFPSMEGLFDLLEEAAKKDPWYMNMNWDPELGYPRDLYVDLKSNVMNDEISYRVVTAPSADAGS
jgi:hypothetical protein